MSNNQLTDGVIDVWFNAAKAAIHHPATTQTEHSHAFAAYMLAQEVRILRAELQERRKASAEPIAYLYSASFERGHVEGQLTDAPGCDLPVYAAAPPAPVVPDELLNMAASAIEDLLEHTDPSTSYYSGVWADVPGKLRAAMLKGNVQ